MKPIFEAKCVKCHGPEKQKSGYRLDVKKIALTGGDDHAPNILPGKSAASPLIKFISGEDKEMVMPPKDGPLSGPEIATLKAWIDAGAIWPEEASTKIVDSQDWWSLRPITKAAPARPGTNPIDEFIRAKLAEKGLTLSTEADQRTLIRRLSFDVIGLPPTPEEVDAFVADTDPNAYEKLVDRLLATPRFGERWARHWLDVVHFGETHGYDKDKPRPNAWPYRDYVIRSFNDDKPYARFIQEQIAGDVLFPNTVDGMEALGFISAGPWDYIGHAEVPESKNDGKIARHLDRDDMISNTINTFCSMTVHCAQCHNHKFDPIPQEDYYALQAVFSALDRTDRKYDTDPAVASNRAEVSKRLKDAEKRVNELETAVKTRAGDPLKKLDERIAELEKPKPGTPSKADAFGYHSSIDKDQNKPRWVQVDLGDARVMSTIVLHPCKDDFNKIGDGFGFPVRFKVELSNDPAFQNGVTIIGDLTNADVKNPGIEPQSFSANGQSARFIRVTATKLAPRQNDFIFALSELEALDITHKNVAQGAAVTSLDSIESGVRWRKTNLTDGYYPGIGKAAPSDIAPLIRERDELLAKTRTPDEAAELKRVKAEATTAKKALLALPVQRVVYAGSVHTGTGAFAGTGANGGKPRPIFVLPRGNVSKPGKEIGPGALSCVKVLPARFEIAPEKGEGERRAALAKWLSDTKNPLPWRSIANRVWQYHFGRPLVETPNDFGRMGALPTHPELLDYLAATLRDDPKSSLKSLHKLIVMSATYRQSSTTLNEKASAFDAENRLLWRMHRRKLEAEAVHDSVLSVAGKLDLTMGGPSYQDFVITHPEHSPHYEYQLADPSNPKIQRRAIYRMIVRSQQQPWMSAQDCADPSMLVDKRNQTLTPLQALAQLNNQLMVVMARDFAVRIKKEAGENFSAQIVRAFQVAVQRNPSADELSALNAYTTVHGLANTCRVIINLNEFVFAD